MTTTPTLRLSTTLAPTMTMTLTAGTPLAWGANNRGQLGQGTTVYSSTPLPVHNLRGVVALAGGVDHTLALRTDGTVWAWGSDDKGQVGAPAQPCRTADGVFPCVPTPVQVHGLPPIVAVSAWANSSLVLGRDGSVWAWGDNSESQLGSGMPTYEPHPTPVQVHALDHIVAIAAGGITSVALRRDGTGRSGPGTTTAHSSWASPHWRKSLIRYACAAWAVWLPSRSTGREGWRWNATAPCGRGDAIARASSGTAKQTRTFTAPRPNG